MGGDDSCAGKISRSTINGLLFGTLLGAGEVAWRNAPMTHHGHFMSTKEISSRIFGRTSLFGILGITFMGTSCVVDSLLAKHKWQSTAAGCMSCGVVIALTQRSPVAGFTLGVLSSIALCAYEYTGPINGNHELIWARNHPASDTQFSK